MKCIGLAVLIFLLFTVPARGENLTLVLDWFPNVDHLPLYVAQEKGFFAEEGLKINITSPSESADALKLVAAGRVELGISYEPQALVAASEGVPVLVIGRLIGHPLSTVLYIKDRGIEKPQDLNGKLMGYTVAGMEDVLARAFCEQNEIKDYTLIHIEFAIIPSLVSKRVDSVMGGFRNYEVVELELEGYAPGYFALEEYGFPDYDELVVIANPKFAKENKKTISSFRRALSKAIEISKDTPEEALDHYFKAVPESDKKLEKRAFEKTLPFYAENQNLEAERWQAFADFALQVGLIEHQVDTKQLLWKD